MKPVQIAAAVFFVVFCLAWLGPHLDGPDELDVASAVAEDARAAPSEALQLAQADAAAERAQHPSTAQPARRRHSSTQAADAQ